MGRCRGGRLCVRVSCVDMVVCLCSFCDCIVHVLGGVSLCASLCVFVRACFQVEEKKGKKSPSIPAPLCVPCMVSPVSFVHATV